MKVIVNEKEIELGDSSDLIGVLAAVDVSADRRGIAVAINERVVRRSEWAGYEISSGDRIEIIQATQGG